MPLTVIDRTKTILAKLESDDTTVSVPAPQTKPQKKSPWRLWTIRSFACVADAPWPDAARYSTVANPSSFAAASMRLSLVKIGPVITES